MPRAPRVADDDVFIPYGIGFVRILKRVDGSLVETLIPDTNGWQGGAGSVDSVYPLHVQRRMCGDYVIFIENCAARHVGMFRWRPGE